MRLVNQSGGSLEQYPTSASPLGKALGTATPAVVVVAITLIMSSLARAEPFFPSVPPSPPPLHTPTKRLQRSNEKLGVVDAHRCTLERNNREMDYLASLTDKELAEYRKAAEAGDAEAMYLLSRLPRETSGGIDYPFRQQWLPRAAQAGQPVAKYLLAEESHGKGQLSHEQFLRIAEDAGNAQSSGDIAWRLSYSYTPQLGDVVTPRPYPFLAPDPAKALQWARLAAAKGNIMAAEQLCTSMYAKLMGGSIEMYGLSNVDPQETVRWCTLAANAMCSYRAPDALSFMFSMGVGVRRSLVDSIYWDRIARERFRMGSRSDGKWDYVEENR